MFRKIATILLLSFLFFNWVGYWLFISCLEGHEEAQWEWRQATDQYDPVRLAEQNPPQLILLKVSASHLPYSNASTIFERVNGKIEIGSIFYRYVGKRLYNDSVEFLCLPDPEANHLREAKNDFFGLVNSLQNTGHTRAPGSQGKAMSNILKICYPDHPCFTMAYFPTRTVRAREYPTAELPTGYLPISGLPPDRGPVVV